MAETSLFAPGRALTSLVMPFHLILSAIVSTLLLHFTWNYMRSPLRTVPGPFLAKFTDLWRFCMVWRRRPEQEQYALHQKYGPVVALGPNMVTISEPRMVDIIYSRKEILIKSKFYSANDFIVAGQRVESSFTTQDENFNSKAMKPVHRMLALNNISKYEPLVDQAIAYFFNCIDERFCGPARTCDLDRWLGYFAADVISEATFSTRMGFMEHGRDIDEITAKNRRMNAYFSLFGQMPILDLFLHKNPYIPIWKLPMFGQSSTITFAINRIDTRRRGVDSHVQGDKPDMLSDYLSAQRADPAAIQEHNILNYVLINVMAGSDTVAATLRYIFYFLARHRDKLQKLQDELDANDVQVPLSWRKSQELPYLDACIREGMRLGPAIPFPFERLVGPTGLVLPDGTVLPPGTIVAMNPYVLSRRKDVFGEDSEAFRPERWLRGAEESEGDFAARFALMRDSEIAFGAGKRVCCGRFVALFEIYKLVGSLCQAYDFELAAGGRPWKTTNRWFMYQEGLDVDFKKR